MTLHFTNEWVLIFPLLLFLTVFTLLIYVLKNKYALIELNWLFSLATAFFCIYLILLYTRIYETLQIINYFCFCTIGYMSKLNFLNIAKNAFKVIVTLAALYWLSRNLHFEEFKQSIINANFWYLFLALLSYITSPVVASPRLNSFFT